MAGKRGGQRRYGGYFVCGVVQLHHRIGFDVAESLAVRGQGLERVRAVEEAAPVRSLKQVFAWGLLFLADEILRRVPFAENSLAALKVQFFANAE